MRSALWLLLLGFFATSVKANPETALDCQKPDELKSLYDLSAECGKLYSEKTKKLPELAVSMEKITSTVCRTVLPGTQSLRTRLERALKAGSEKTKILDLNVQGGKRLIDAVNLILGQYPTPLIMADAVPNSKKPIEALKAKLQELIRQNGQKPISAFDAMDALFGKDQATLLIYLADRFKINASFTQKSTLERVDDENLRQAAQALLDLPDPLTQKAAHRLAIRQDLTPSESAAEHRYDRDYGVPLMVFFKRSKDPVPGYRNYVVFHEFMHVVDRSFGRVDGNGKARFRSESDDWTSYSGGWKVVKGTENARTIRYTPLDTSVFFSTYAQESMQEDFAESVIGYRYEPETLKKASPKKYEFIRKNLFNGVEYTSENECSKSKPGVMR